MENELKNFPSEVNILMRPLPVSVTKIFAGAKSLLGRAATPKGWFKPRVLNMNFGGWVRGMAFVLGRETKRTTRMARAAMTKTIIMMLANIVIFLLFKNSTNFKSLQ